MFSDSGNEPGIHKVLSNLLNERIKPCKGLLTNVWERGRRPGPVPSTLGLQGQRADRQQLEQIWARKARGEGSAQRSREDAFLSFLSEPEF